MTTRTYIVLLALAGTIVSATGAFFSVTGLMHLFAGASISVAVMAGSLEFSKFVVVGFVYRYWGHIHRPLRAYLVFSVAVLMAITSIGIYGYLSAAYQVSALDLHTRLIEIKTLQTEEEQIRSQASELRDFIDKIPNSRITRKLEFQQKYQPKMDRLRNRSVTLQEEINTKQQELLKTNNKVGPIVYLAQALNKDIDTVVKYFILFFVSVFDPLAVSLIFSLNVLIRLREKYNDNEFKIGSRSLTNLVDHRKKKAS